MSGRLECNTPGPALCGVEGELVSVRILIEPRSLERALDALARLEFPINPQICHGEPSVAIEFPAWSSRLDDVRAALRQSGLGGAVVNVSSMLNFVRSRGLVA